MSYVLKRDPVWLDLSLSTGCGVFLLLSEDGHQVSVPGGVLLAISPLLRSMVSDLHPAAHGPLVLSIAISGDVLLLVGDIMTKGVAFVMGDRIKGEVQAVLKMMGVDVILDSCMLNEVVNGGRNDEIKLEVLESLDELTTKDCILNKKKSLEELLKDAITSIVVENRRISATEEYPQQGVEEGLNLKIENLRSIDNMTFNADMHIKVVKPVRSKMNKEKPKTQKPAGEKRFNCDDCDYSTEFRKDMERHKRTHSREKPFSCEFCDYLTSRSDHLLSHTRKHTEGVKLFYCEYCDYSITSNSRLAIHVRKHTEKKPYQCGDCDYSAASKHIIVLHRRMHTGEKPYKCDNCDYRAAQEHHITSHKKVKHTVVKPF